MDSGTEQIFLLNPSAESGPASGQPLKMPEASTPPQCLDSVKDFTNVCRMCATITEFVIPIFSGEGLQNGLAEKIRKYLPIQVSERDELPQAVCYGCAHTLLAWHELVACCRQADAALRTRLQRHTARAPDQDLLPPATKNEGNTDVTATEKQKRFVEIRVLEISVEQAPPAASSACGYCGAVLAGARLEEHLLAAHSDRLFHCDECRNYVDRKYFILHMSLHAAAASAGDRPERKPQPDENGNTDPAPPTAPPAQTPPSAPETPRTTTKPQNLFSDHSDTEDGFGPIPDSVFDAIEESRDGPDGAADPGEPPKLNPRSKRPRTCPICTKVYTASSSYFYHLKYFHKQSKEHECEVCGRKFGTKASLNEHVTIHTGECQMECKECGKRFRSKASLYIHQQTHSGVKSYACTQCQLSFRWRTHLQRHMKRHSAEKAHVCSSCGRGFNIRCDLLRHARTHTAGSHTCEKCGVKFAQLRYLKVHMDKKHTVGTQVSALEKN